MKNISVFRRISFLSALSISGFCITACGQLEPSSSQKTGITSSSSLSIPAMPTPFASSGVSSLSGNTCPSSQPSAISLDGAAVGGSYQVCAGPSGSGDVVISPVSGAISSICAFPMEGSTSFMPAASGQVSPVVYQCQTIASSGTTFSLGGGSWNAVLIIAQSNLNQLIDALEYGAYLPANSLWAVP